jgi:DNA-binding response OmpR family regulator
MNPIAPVLPVAKSDAILVIEDETPTSLGLETELLRRGFKADVAATAGEAISRLSEFAYNAVLLDLMLPDGGLQMPQSEPKRIGYRFLGVEVLRRIRRGDFAGQGTAAKVPVFVLTCVLDQDTRQELESLGIQAFWSKPESLSRIAERVKLFFHTNPES